MDLQEQNWNNFCDYHLNDWHGTRTRYGPQGEVTEFFEAFRLLRANPEKTEITHTNINIYADGTKEERTWPFTKESNNFIDGLMHPITPLMRFLTFENGHGAGIYKKLETNSNFGVELFFRKENLRHSIVIVYGEKGGLRLVSIIREDAKGWPSKYWSTEVNLATERNLSGNWQGTSVTMTPDLKASPPVPTQLHWPIEGNTTFFYPDGISLSCPMQVSVGIPFTISGTWLVTPSELQQVSVKYDESGTFSWVRRDLFNLEA